jgi:hypothetical protein
MLPPSSGFALFSPAFRAATSDFNFLMELKLARTDGLSEAGFSLRAPKNVDGLGARETEVVRCTDDGLEGAFEDADGLNAAALALGRNSIAFTFRLNLEDEVVEVGVCKFDLWGLRAA